MYLLSLECSSDERSVALVRDGEVVASRCLHSGRATPLLGMIGEVLAAAGTDRGAIHAILVGLGPGSYTGIRGALSVALGWRAATGVRVLGADSLSGCAEQAVQAGLCGPVALIVDAQRGEFYVDQRDLTPGGPIRLSPLRLATRREIDQLSGQGVPLVGPGVGSGGGIPGTRMMPGAGPLARAVAAGWALVSEGDPEPIYLRTTSFVKAPPPRVIPGLSDVPAP